MNNQQAKQRFGIIGNSPKLARAIDVALQVAPTDISVLVVGESGTGKENIPKIDYVICERPLSVDPSVDPSWMFTLCPLNTK